MKIDISINDNTFNREMFNEFMGTISSTMFLIDETVIRKKQVSSYKLKVVHFTGVTRIEIDFFNGEAFVKKLDITIKWKKPPIHPEVYLDGEPFNLSEVHFPVTGEIIDDLPLIVTYLAKKKVE